MAALNKGTALQARVAWIIRRICIAVTQLLSFAVAAVALTSCRAAEPSSQAVGIARRDSAGVTVIMNSTEASISEWRVGPRPMSVLGTALDDHGLYEVSSAVRLANGDIVVANSGTSEVLVFNSRSRLVGSFGRRGRGPGEFVGPIRVVSSEANEIVVEAGTLQRKLLRFTPAGELREEVLLPPQVSLRGGAWSYPAMSSSGVEFILREPLEPAGPGHGGPERGRLSVVRFSYYGGRADTVGTYPGDAFFLADVGPRPAFGGGSVSGPRAIQPLFSPTTVLAGGGKPWRAIVGDQAHACFDVYEEDGTRVQRVCWHATSRRPSSADFKLAGDAYVRSHRADTLGARRALGVMPPTAATPVFDQLVVGRDNRVWVRAYVLPTDSVGRWWVFHPDGELVARVGVPVGAQVLEVGESYVLTRMTDSLDVERVELWPMVVH